MRVNAGRLDLASLTIGHTCTIITTDSAVWLSQQGHPEIRTGITVEGRGSFYLTTHERNTRTDWLNLRALQPGRMYRALVKSRGEDGIGWELSDVTPDYFNRAQSGGQGWGVLGRLL